MLAWSCTREQWFRELLRWFAEHVDVWTLYEKRDTHSRRQERAEERDSAGSKLFRYLRKRSSREMKRCIRRCARANNEFADNTYVYAIYLFLSVIAWHTRARVKASTFRTVPGERDIVVAVNKLPAGNLLDIYLFIFFFLSSFLPSFLPFFILFSNTELYHR